MSKQIVEIEGFKELQAKIKQLPDKLKKREMLKIMRAGARPTIIAARNAAPVGDKPHSRYSRRTGEVLATYQPGNLKKSINHITGRRGLGRENAVLYVGPRSKGKKYDGYYGHFVHEGTANRDAAPNPFMEKAYRSTRGQVTSDLQRRVAKALQRQINKLSS